MLTALILSAAMQSAPEVCLAAAGTARPDPVAAWNDWATSPAAGRWYARAVVRPASAEHEALLARVAPARPSPSSVWIGEAGEDVFLLAAPSGCGGARGYTAALIDGETGEIIEAARDLMIVRARFEPVVFTGGARRD